MRSRLFKQRKQKGISVLLAVLIMAIILAVALGVSAILLQQMRMIAEIGYSVVAFYAADSGIELTLYNLYKNSTYPDFHRDDLSNNAFFEVYVRCQKNTLSGSCFLTSGDAAIDPGCEADNICIKSVGSFENHKRAIEAKY